MLKERSHGRGRAVDVLKQVVLSVRITLSHGSREPTKVV